MRKKVDSRIRVLLENCVKLQQRGLFVIIGDKGREQVVNLHYMLSKASVKARPSVLWCYKKDLFLSSHRKKRVRQIKKLQMRGLLDVEKEDPFSLFVASTNIRYCYYNESQNILGQTFGMAVLQDFEALTPNLLARTIETVEGGGLVVLLLSNLNSLTQLYSLTMDIHSRLRTESHQEVRGRFNERLVLSLASNPHCLMMDDELNVLPTSSLIRTIVPIPLNPDGSPEDDPRRAASKELRDLAESLVDTQPAGSLVGKCRTLDQARAVVTFLDAASEKTLRSTVALTASRGRGKSAALGLSIAGALALGYSNIFVTAPSPENLRTLFEFVFKGLDGLGYKEHIDYDLVESSNPAWGKAIVRVNIFRNHRQTVQYIQPGHHAKLAQAELLVIDEAAAIPLPVVKALLGPYLVFLCSTVNGYEGTGRSLSLKLIQQLREQGAKIGGRPRGQGGGRSWGRAHLQVGTSMNCGRQMHTEGGGRSRGRAHLQVGRNTDGTPPKPGTATLQTQTEPNTGRREGCACCMARALPGPRCETPSGLRVVLVPPYRAHLQVGTSVGCGRQMHTDSPPPPAAQLAAFSERDRRATALGVREVTLGEPIRYAPGDPVESWLHNVLCLDATTAVPKQPARLPHPEECELFFVERDTLFSYHAASEKFLQGMVSLFVASHYKNTPNDLILMSDAPAHQLFVLLAPVDESKNTLPDVMAVIQIALEGAISKNSSSSSLARGEMPTGDLIPWTIGQQYQDPEFPMLSGARVVRIAVHPDVGRAGYGTRAVDLLRKYYQGELASLGDEEDEETEKPSEASQSKVDALLLTETLKPRSGLPPLLVNLSERKPEHLHYLGVAYGLTQQLYNFWHKSGFEPLYLRQSASDITGEHSIIMVAPLQSAEVRGTAWLTPFVDDFKARFMSLLAGTFKDMAPALALSILDPTLQFSEATTQAAIQAGTTVLRGDGAPLSPYDLKRLQAYSNSLVDYHLILDLLPSFARAYFAGRVPATLSYGQAAILLSLGLQQQELSAVEAALELPASQVLALFNKAVRKLYLHLRATKEAAVARTLPQVKPAPALLPHAVDMDEELDEAADEQRNKMREKYLQPEDLAQYAIAGEEAEFDAAATGQSLAAGGLLSVKSSGLKKRGAEGAEEEAPTTKGSNPSLYKKDGKKQRKSGGAGSSRGGAGGSKHAGKHHQ
ncbi:MAG: hypothetical protein WDW38_008540 [Sanguina aurantia]